MKTIYLRTKRSGNYEFSNRKESDLKFKTKKEFKNWYENKRGSGRIIKATYRLSQTYFERYDFESAFKKAKEIF